VELSSCTATAVNSHVTLRWRTETELDNAGFNIYRGNTEDGNYTRIGFVYAAEDAEMGNDYQFTDKEVEPGKTYFYYLEDIDLSGEKNRPNIIEVAVPTAKYVQPVANRFRLLQNFPNPFNPETWIPYLLAEPAVITIRIYAVNGRLVRTINLGAKNAGVYVDRSKSVHWNGRNNAGERVSSGVYFYTLEARVRTEVRPYKAVRRMVIMK